jgi:hydrogenase maturation protease
MNTYGKNYLIIGIGNEYRSDDAAGLITVRKLRDKNIGNMRVIENSGDGALLIEEWKNSENVVIVDAICTGRAPGFIHSINANNESLPVEKVLHSSHLFGLADAVETARVLKQLPENLTIYGIEGKSFEPGITMSAEVQKSAGELADIISRAINTC